MRLRRQAEQIISTTVAYSRCISHGVQKDSQAGTTQKRFCGFRVGLPRLLEKLPISEQAIRKIRSANETHLLRFYFGTADTSDVDAIYTHLLISWGLAGA